MYDMVFVSSKLHGKNIQEVEDNINEALKYCKWFVCTRHVLPIAPHTYLTRFLNLNDSNEDEIGRLCCRTFMQQCKDFYLVVNHDTLEFSTGMRDELDTALELGKKIHIIDWGDKIENYDIHNIPYEFMNTIFVREKMCGIVTITVRNGESAEIIHFTQITDELRDRLYVYMDNYSGDHNYPKIIYNLFLMSLIPHRRCTKCIYSENGLHVHATFENMD